VADLDHLFEALSRIAVMKPEYWVGELRLGTGDGRVWTFDSIWPGGMAEARVWCGVKLAVLMSGTFTPQNGRQLGIKKEVSQFREWDRVFPAANTPIIYIPTMNVKYGADVQPLIDRTHRIIESGRKARKGCIHTVSYALQRAFLERCRYSQYFYCNTGEADSPNAMEVFQRFVQAEASEERPAILVSPSFSTGWDMAGRICEWQIVAKMAYLNVKSKLVEARLKQWPAYSDANAIQTLVQASLRASRFPEDYCEVFILDDNVVRLLARNKALAPRYFKYSKSLTVPKAGVKRAPQAAPQAQVILAEEVGVQ
jgi:Rad3-related DNA helicase